MDAPALHLAPDPVAVAIPAWNDRPGLERLLDRLDATGARLEVIVVDDASEDDTQEALATRPPPPGGALRLLRNAANLGPGPSRNRAIDAAEAEALLFIDADDLPHRDLFAWLADAPPRAPADFTLFRHHFCTREGRLFPGRMTARDEAAWDAARRARGDLAGLVRLEEAPSLAGMIAFPWTRLFRTEFLRGRDVRFPELRLHEDLPFHWAAWLRAEAFLVLDHAPPLLHHFQLERGGRATDAADARRLDAFRALDMVLEQEPSLAGAPGAAGAFIDFSVDLVRWVRGLLKGGPHAAEAARAAAALGGRLVALAEVSGAEWEDREAHLEILGAGEAADA
ncbi:glycosyltransferase family 2 protein [Rhodovulum sp. DZ06]|uniref:glycosyltransferase family 2 protein n=1 Tax=Rhodovulum sp. DZ06 TaxID=3425126 RepID=UPI003D35628D